MTKNLLQKIRNSLGFYTKKDIAEIERRSIEKAVNDTHARYFRNKTDCGATEHAILVFNDFRNKAGMPSITLKDL